MTEWVFSLLIKKATQPVMRSIVGSMTSILQPFTTCLQDEVREFLLKSQSVPRFSNYGRIMNKNNAEVSASYFVSPSSVGLKSDTIHFAFWDNDRNSARWGFYSSQYCTIKLMTLQNRKSLNPVRSLVCFQPCPFKIVGPQVQGVFYFRPLVDNFRQHVLLRWSYFFTGKD